MDNIVLSVLPRKLADMLLNINTDDVQEIRIRLGKIPILITRYDEVLINEYIITINDMNEIVSRICQSSVYAMQEQIKNGFVTIKGGHRVGIIGRAIQENGKIINQNDFSGLNIRIARQVIGCADNVMNGIVVNNRVRNTIIISPPGQGKTTLLRDIVRQLSNGVKQIGFKGVKVGLIDERSEISACVNGIPQNDIGLRTDVIYNSPKPDGIRLLIRSMSPAVIATDEIASVEDADSILEAISCGVNIICTAHGKKISDMCCRQGINKLIDMNIFENNIFLSKGEVVKNVV